MVMWTNVSQMLRGLSHLYLFWQHLGVIVLWLKASNQGMLITDLNTIRVGMTGIFIDLLGWFSEFLIEFMSWSKCTLFSKNSNKTNSS